MKKTKKIKSLSVSDLCFYAENPAQFCQNQGRPTNAYAAKYGTDAHNKLASTNTARLGAKVSHS